MGDVSGGPLTRLTFSDDDVYGLWTPDGKRLFYTSGEGGRYNIYSVTTDGTGQPERLTNNPNAQQATSISPDGNIILFHEVGPSTTGDIWQYDLSSRRASPLIKTPFKEGDAVFSPDGHAIAYMSTQSGRAEIYVQSYPDLAIKRQVSVDGGILPAWNPKGHELFYQSASGFVAVPIIDWHELRMGPSATLFRLKGPSDSRVAVSPDGQRFLTFEPTAGAQSSSQISIVERMFEELKQRLPSK